MRATRGPGQKAAFPGLVGRERELDAIRRALDTGQPIEPRFVLIAGEPGIGKTHLLVQAADMARSTGWRVLVGHSYDSEGMPPYLPFIEAIGEYVRGCPAEELKVQLGDDAADIALLLPELRRGITDIPAASATDPASDRYRLFESVAAFLEAIGGSSPSGVVLCLEDLQWADDSTLLLLEHLSRRSWSGHFLTLITYRDTDLDPSEPLVRTLEQLARGRLAQRLDLKRLSREDVATMLAALGRPDPPLELVEAACRETDGNPFFVQALFEYLASEGRLFYADGNWIRRMSLADLSVPRSVRLVIERRLERLSQTCRRVLSIAAVLGRKFRYDLLRAISDLSDLEEESLFTSLEEAERTHILLLDPSGEHSFSHELIRQTLLTGLTLPRRQRLHLHIAEAIEASQAGNLEANLPVLAAHYLDSGRTAQPEKVVHFCQRAADQAFELLAFEESIRLYGLAIEALKATPPASASSELLRILHFKRGEAFAALAAWPDAKNELDAALALLLPGHDDDRAELLTALAFACRWSGHPDEGRRHAARALELAEMLGRQDLLARALSTRALLEFSEGETIQGANTYREAIERAHGVRGQARQQAEAGFAHLLYLTNQYGDSVDHGLEGARLAREMGDVATLTFALGPLGLALAARGHYGDADAAFKEATQVGRRYGVGSYLARALAMSTGPHIDLLDYEGALAISEEARDLARSGAFIPAIVSTGIDLLFIQVRRGAVESASQLLPEVALGASQGAGLHRWLWKLRLAQVEAEIACANCDWRETARLATISIEHSRAKGRTKYEVAALNVRGKALVALGRKKDALTDLRRAVEIARPTGDPAMLVRSAASLLALEPQRSVVAEAWKAAQNILAALPAGQMQHAFENSDEVRLIAKLETARDSGVRISAPVSNVLSERQLQVLHLIAEGKTNREIATELVLSERTVQRHAADVYVKIGVRNRVEATAFALSRL